MSNRCWRMLITVTLGWSSLGALTTPNYGQETEAAKPAKVDVPALIRQLDSEDFSARQDASQRLAAAGEAAIPALEKAVESDSREVSSRAFDILKAHFDKGSPGVKDAAKQSLDRLAKADLGSISKQAGDILTPPKTAATPNGLPRVAPGGIMPAPGIRIAVGRVAIAAGGAAGGIETSIKVENGVKTTEVKDKDRKVKIVDDPDKGLQLEVTETKDGKEETKKYAAKNADELKKNDPEAYKIYEQYSQKGAEIKFGGGVIGRAIPFAPGAPIPPARLVPAVPAIPVPEAAGKQRAEAIEALEKSLQDAEANLKQLSKDLGDNEQVAKARARLEEARKQLEALRSALK